MVKRPCITEETVVRKRFIKGIIVNVKTTETKV
jgi:hypothetical protein